MIKLDRNEILRYMGALKADRDTLRLIDECEELLLKVSSPKYIYKCFDCECREKEVLIAGGVKLSGEDIRTHLSKSEKCVLMAATLGSQTDREIKRESVKSIKTAVIFDACATAYIEKICDKAQQEITEKYGEVNFRFSPGYGDFPIEEQGGLLSLLDAQKKIGLTLSGSNTLIPSKSVTAVLGVLKDR